MTKRILLLSLATMLSLAAAAQRADKSVAKMIAGEEYFRLEAEYPSLRTEMVYPDLRLAVDAMLGSVFNRPRDTIEAVAKLMSTDCQVVGVHTLANLMLLHGIYLMEEGRYAEAADSTASFFDKHAGDLDQSFVPPARYVLRVSEALRDFPPSRAVRPGCDVEVPLTFSKMGRGECMTVPVSVGGVTEEFIFDTGCSAFNMVSDECAERMGIRIVADSIPVTGATLVYLKLGVADMASVGDVEYQNPVFLIFERDGMAGIHGVLGLHFMKQLQEFRTYPAEGKVVFPAANTIPPDDAPNMMLISNQPYAEVWHSGKEYMLHFDTGNVKSDLHELFYKKNKRWVRRNGTRDVSNYGGFGAVRQLDVYRLPSVEMSICSEPFTLDRVEVTYNAGGLFDHEFAGSLGTDFVKAFRCLTVNFKDMFVTGRM